MGGSDPTKNKELQPNIDKAKQLLQKKQYAAAIDVTTQILTEHPDQIDALYIAAVCHRYQNNSESALAILNQLKSYYVNYARAYQEEGHNYRFTDGSAAIKAYEQAVLLNPALLASWKNLSELYKVKNDTWAANQATLQFQYWAKMPRELVSVSSLINENKILKAEDICRYFLRQQPKHVEAMRLLASIGVHHKVLDDAEFLLESCLAFEPEFHQARFDYVNVLHRRQKYQKALEQAQILRDKSPENIRYQMAFANENQAVGEFEKAIQIYANLLKKIPEDSGVHIMQGHAYKTLGNTKKAIEAYQNASACKDNYGDAFWSLANLKTYSFSAAEITRMQDLEKAPTTAFEDKYHLCFALGKAFEDKGNYEQSFEYYERGNALKKQQLGYTSERIEAECKAQKEVCSPALFAQHTGATTNEQESTTPIFIVGLPRAGSTLLEQILSSHSMVDGTMELPNIMSLSHRLNGRGGPNSPKRYPKILTELTAEQLQTFGKDYIEDTKIYRQGAPFFIDKMPNNFRHLGLISLILPNAKIIDARRDPMSCCFSVFKQLFAEGQEFSYSLEDAAKYYKDYLDLMDHWNKVLPNKILHMQYENVVNDLETQVHRILDFCGLPFEAQCLNFHETKRSVRTASSEQVRQPIFKSGMEQWKNFETQLQPLKALVADMG
ncbi:MAG: sulfotransferase [Paraglaciecola sp.]|uniref:tetratricopeptide repeat-containing sulfotransferase family protein n=2 Tax=Paraglaciecola sp. TaxID=1920173 RepID=UPI003299C623